MFTRNRTTNINFKIGEEEDTLKKLNNKELEFEVGVRKLLNISTNDLDVESIGKEHEELIQYLEKIQHHYEKLDPLWESMVTRIKHIIEETGLVSQEYILKK